MFDLDHWNLVGYLENNLSNAVATKMWALETT